MKFALGVDIGATNTKVALVSEGGEMAGIERFPTGRDDPAQLIGNIGEASARCRGATAICGAGVAVAGFISREHDRLSYNPNLEWMVGFPFGDSLSYALGGPVQLEVDLNF